MELRTESPCYNGSSSDAIEVACDWDYDVWVFWPSTGRLLPEADDKERYEKKGLEASQLQSDEAKQQLGRVDSMEYAVNHASSHDSIRSATSRMGTLGYSRVFRAGLVSNVEPSSVVYSKL